MTGFVGGVTLAGRFYAAVVCPLIGDRPHTAALIGVVPPIGAVDQFVESTPVLGDVRRCREITRAALER